MAGARGATVESQKSWGFPAQRGWGGLVDREDNV